MAKAVGKPTTWVFLKDAKARADSVYQSHELAGEQLTEWLSAGKLRWRSDTSKGSKRDCDPGSGDPEFWREPAPAPPVINLHNLVTTWDQSRAERNSYMFYRIEVAEDDLAKLLPASSPRQEKRKWRRDELTPVVDEMFPSGPPKEKSTVELVQQLGDELKQRGIRGVSEPTMERALGRRR